MTKKNELVLRAYTPKFTKRTDKKINGRLPVYTGKPILAESVLQATEEVRMYLKHNPDYKFHSFTR